MSVSAGAFCWYMGKLHPYFMELRVNRVTQRVMKAVLLQRDQVSAGRTTRTTDLHRESLTTHATENCSKHTSLKVQINRDGRMLALATAVFYLLVKTLIVPLSVWGRTQYTKYMSTDAWHCYQDPFMHIFTFAYQCNWVHVIIFKDRYLNPLKNHACM